MDVSFPKAEILYLSPKYRYRDETEGSSYVKKLLNITIDQTARANRPTIYCHNLFTKIILNGMAKFFAYTLRQKKVGGSLSLFAGSEEINGRPGYGVRRDICAAD